MKREITISEHMRKIQRLGGIATFKKHGVEHYKKMSALGVKARKANKNAKKS